MSEWLALKITPEMKVRDLSEQLQKLNPEGELHLFEYLQERLTVIGGKQVGAFMVPVRDPNGKQEEPISISCFRGA
jgi:hypothetical protein